MMLYHLISMVILCYVIDISFMDVYLFNFFISSNLSLFRHFKTLVVKSSVFNITPISLFTINRLSLLPRLPTNSSTFHYPYFRNFVNYNILFYVIIKNSICDPTYPAPEPHELSNTYVFTDGLE